MTASNATLEKTAEKKAPAISKVSENYTAKMGGDIRNMLENGRIVLPADYSVENALRFAWLALQDVQDKDKRPALVTCTPESIINALFGMVAQGLTVEKKQGYFLVYGNSLAFQRSYFGDMALAKRLRPGIEFYYNVVRQGEEFAWETLRGRTVVTCHRASLETLSNPIVAAYCGITTESGEDLGVDIMTMDRIKKSWAKSKTAKYPDSTHNEFTDEMALRTVIRHRAKAIINSSSDSELLKAVEQNERLAALAAVNADADENANGTLLSLDPVTESQAPEPQALEQSTVTPAPAHATEAELQPELAGDDLPEYMK